MKRNVESIPHYALGGCASGHGWRKIGGTSGTRQRRHDRENSEMSSRKTHMFSSWLLAQACWSKLLGREPSPCRGDDIEPTVDDREEPTARSRRLLVEPGRFLKSA